ncbi:MAG: hypothetical protein ACTS27_01090 [Phycisphaerales bacterium]
MPTEEAKNGRTPHASFAGVYFPLSTFDPSRVDDANAAYKAARDAIRKAMPRPAQRRALARRYGFAEAVSGLEGLARENDSSRAAEFESNATQNSPDWTVESPDIDLSHESTLLGVLARLDRAEAFSGTDVVHMQLHWAVRWRHSVLTARPSTLSAPLREDPRTAGFAPTRRPIGSASEFDPPGREIRVVPPSPSATATAGDATYASDIHSEDRVSYAALFNTEALCTPRAWRAVIGIACLVRLVAEAEIGAELGMTRLRRCASPRCGAWFVEKRPGARLRTHCSPGCRVAAVRARAGADSDE